MTRTNRVRPDGSLAAHPAQGAFMGNRGCLHDEAGAIRRAFVGKAWITCTLNLRPGGTPRPHDQPGRYTPLFFTDEAVACAAGHRPCFECRRAVAKDFAAAWTRAFGTAARAREMDAVLHSGRWDRASRQRLRPLGTVGGAPDGVFFLWNGAPHLVWQGSARPWSFEGYGSARPLPQGQHPVLTPEPLVKVMRAGWRPILSRDEDRPNW